MQTVFITGGTGYIGKRLIRALLLEGNYRVMSLVRKGSEYKLPGQCEVVVGNALDAESYQHKIPAEAIFIHLVGVAHPSPAKKEQFKTIDAVSVEEAAKAATTAAVSHFIYVSVAMYPSRIMAAFQEVRAAGERRLLACPFKTSFIRPWYVIGPGHWWPLLLNPFYFIACLIPSKKEAARQLGTVRLQQMINCLVYAVKHEPEGNRVYGVEEIKKFLVHGS